MAKIGRRTGRSLGNVSKDLRAFVKKSDRALKKMVDNEMKAALLDISKVMIKDIQVNLTPHVHKGILMRSIGRKLVKKSRRFPFFRRVLVGPRLGEKWKGKHGHLLEAGTTDRMTNKVPAFRGSVTAKPYMAPAFDKNKGMIERRIRSVVSRFPRKLKV